MKDNIKAAMIAAAAEALKYKESHPHAKDDEIINYIMKISDNILRNID